MRVSTLLRNLFKDQRGQTAAIFLAVFAILLVFFLVPRKFQRPAEPTGDCVAGKRPTKEVILRGLPAIENIFDEPRRGREYDRNIGGPDPVEKADYILIREGVPIAKKSTTGGWYFLGDKEARTDAHTINTGENPIKPGYDLYYPAEWGEVDVKTSKISKYIRGEGMIIFVKNKPGVTAPLPDDAIVTADIYQDKRIYDAPKDYDYEDFFKCLSKQKVGTVMIPPQNPSLDNQQLQLEWFIFSSSGVWGIHCKPAIYLYPPQKQLVNVKVSPAGFLVYTDPQYDSKAGWTVEANPDGVLTNLDPVSPKNYPYLYFESKVRDEVIQKPTKGWVVKYEELNNLYQTILPKLGLNSQQNKDFSDYWNKALHPAPYYFVGVIDQSNVDQIERLDITPKPDNINRVRIYFERLDESKTVEAPVLTSPLTHNPSNFNVVEWGGMVKNDPNHPFTCSQ